MAHGWAHWAGFLGFVAAMLALDLGVFHRKEHVVWAREALAWSAVWVGLALAFAALVWKAEGPAHGLEFLTGYVIEKSLSVDNLFVFVVLFGALGIPPVHQHRVLFWGILSALVLRGAMIGAGAALLTRFHFVVYLFGGFLVLTGIRLALAGRGGHDPGQSRLLADPLRPGPRPGRDLAGGGGRDPRHRRRRLGDPGAPAGGAPQAHPRGRRSTSMSRASSLPGAGWWS
jgi:tellurite resistance protein TerC